MNSYTGIIAFDAQSEKLNHGIELRKILEDFECRDMFVCEARKDAVKYAIYGENQSDFLILVGGPSSLRDVMGVVHKPILYIPNDVPNLKQYIKDAFFHDMMEIPTYRLNNEYFSHYACGGYITNSLFELKRQELQLKKLKREVVKRVLEVEPKAYSVSLDIDGKKIDRKCMGIAVASQDFLSQFSMDPNMDIDSELQVFLLHPANRMEMLLDLKELSKRKITFDDLHYVESFHGKNIDIEIPKAFQDTFYLDGYATRDKQTRISITPSTSTKLILAKKY